MSAAAVADLTIDYVEIAPGDHRFIFYRSDEITPAADDRAASTACGSGRGNCGGGCASRR